MTDRDALMRVTAFVRDDAQAITYQSIGQYRTAVLRVISTGQPESREKCPTCSGPWPCSRCTTRNVVDLDALKASLENERQRDALIARLRDESQWFGSRHWGDRGFREHGEAATALMKQAADALSTPPPALYPNSDRGLAQLCPGVPVAILRAIQEAAFRAGREDALAKVAAPPPPAPPGEAAPDAVEGQCQRCGERDGSHADDCRDWRCDHCGYDRESHREGVASRLERDGHFHPCKAEQAHGYLSRLFTHHAPQCTPLPDLMGVCTQIDNLLAGMAGASPERCGYIHVDGWTCGRAKGHPSVHVPPSRMANPPRTGRRTR